MKSFKLIFIMIAAYLVVFPSSLCADLSKSNFDIIRIAFMNGYANAIQTDMDTIKALKKDKAKLKKYSEIAVNRYMDKVCSLNQKGMIADSKNEKISPHLNSMPL